MFVSLVREWEPNFSACFVFILLPTQNANAKQLRKNTVCLKMWRGESEYYSFLFFCSTNGNYRVGPAEDGLLQFYFFLFVSLVYHYLTYHFAKPTESFAGWKLKLKLNGCLFFFWNLGFWWGFKRLPKIKSWTYTN